MKVKDVYEKYKDYSIYLYGRPLEYKEYMTPFSYLPMNTDVIGIGWDAFDAWVFESDFSKWVYYKSRIIENKTTNTAIITLRVK